MEERVDQPAPVRDLDWDSAQARAFGEEILGIWEELLARLPELPVARADTAEAVRAAVALPVPDQPMPREELVAYLREIALQWSIYPGHPGFMAYITGTGTVPGAAAELLASALNQNVGGWRLSPAATEIELSLMRWFATRLGLPAQAGGLLTSGGAMATFVALKAARDAKAGWDIRRQGTGAGPPLTVYASEEIHAVTERAADMLGLGTEAVRHLPTDARLRLRVDALREAIAVDRAAGRQPIAVVGTAGTTSTGAVDPLADIADVCAEHGLWFHVDGAYGGIAAMVTDLQPLFRVIERADSIAFDPQKWLYTPHSGGAVIVRDLQRLSDSFAIQPTYVHEDKELTRSGLDFFALGPQFSRGFQALKIWVSLLAHGWAAYERRIMHDIALADYLYKRARTQPEFEVMAPQSLSIACFRYVPSSLPRAAPSREPYLDRLNERLMAEIQRHGRVFPSNAVLGGHFALRACIVNFRTEAADIDALLSVASELGRRLDQELRPPGLRS